MHILLILLAALWMVTGVIAEDHQPPRRTRRQVWQEYSAARRGSP